MAKPDPFYAIGYTRSSIKTTLDILNKMPHKPWEVKEAIWHLERAANELKDF